METITSRKNKTAAEFRMLLSDPEARRSAGLYVCDGEKLLRDALRAGAEIVAVIAAPHTADDISEALSPVSGDTEIYLAPESLISWLSPLKSSTGPLFTVRYPGEKAVAGIKSAIVLENIQDPGNVGAIIRSANALSIGQVILTGACADPYGLKTVRAAMGALFRQSVLRMTLEGLREYLSQSRLALYGAALSENAADVRTVPLNNSAVAIGSEGRGLSRELLSICAGEIIIPISPGSDSLNAACAATVLMWEMAR